MTTFIDRLELSVRSANVIKGAGISSYEAFMGLTRENVVMLPGGGIRVWREVSDVQENLKNVQALFRDPVALPNGVTVTHDGYQVWLGADDPRNCAVSLEAEALTALIEYCRKSVPGFAKHLSAYMAKDDSVGD